MKPPFCAILVAGLFVLSLCPGCQTASAARRDRGNRVAFLLAKFIGFQRRLPNSRAELLADADSASERAALRALRTLSIRALGPSTARVEFSDSRAVSDYRIVAICGRHSPRLTRGGESLPPSIFRDPNVVFLFSH